MRWEEGSRPVPGQVIIPSPFFFYTHQKNVVVFQNPKNTYFFSLLFMLYSKEHRTQKIQIQIHHQFLFSYKLVGESPFSPTKLLPNKTFGVWILCPIRDNPGELKRTTSVVLLTSAPYHLILDLNKTSYK